MHAASTAPQAIYHAQTAYHLREFAKTKRYTMLEIQAFIVHQNHADRLEVEYFIRDVFAVSYQTTVTHFMPILVAMPMAA